MSETTFDTRWNQHLSAVESALDSALQARHDLDPGFLEVLRYSVLGGGKRVRPVLCLAACEAAGGKAEDALPAACAIEFLHAYSLVHDDLPAMDDDDERRGQPTVHRKWDEATAILAGDALQAEAFLLVSDRRNWSPRVSIESQLQIVREIAASVSSSGMVGGQAIDIAARERRLENPDIDQLHALKTGALIRAAALCGSLVSGAAPLEVAAMAQFGAALGRLFQLTDDLLDVDELEEGATAADAGGEAAVNYYFVLGEDALKEAIRKTEMECIEAVDVFAPRDRFLKDFASKIANRSH